MDGEVGPPANFPKETGGTVDGICEGKYDSAEVRSSDLLEAFNLDLQTGDLDPRADDFDRDGVDFDHGYDEDSPPSSALCAKSCSCDSCVNISHCISLEFSKGSSTDLAHIDNIEQRINTSLETSRHQSHRCSDTSYRHTLSLPRYTKFRSTRWLASTRGKQGIRRTPRFLRSSRSRSQSHDEGSRPVSETSRESSFDEIAQNLAKPPAVQPENVALFDHMMSYDPVASLGEAPSLSDHRQNRSARSSENASTTCRTPPVETQRTVSFNTPHQVSSSISVGHNRNPTPCASATRIQSPRPSLTRSYSSATWISSPRTSLTRNRNNSPHSSRSRIDLAKNTSTGLRAAHKTRIDTNTLRAIVSGRATPSDINELRRRSNKSSRSLISVSLSRSHSNSKFSDRRSELNSIHKKENSQVEPKPKKRANVARGRAIGVLPTTSVDMSRTSSDMTRAHGRQTNTKGHLPPSAEEVSGFRPVQRKRQDFSKEGEQESGPVPMRDIRHTDSGFGSSASSALSPSPRGQTHAHHYIIKKRLEKTGSNPDSTQSQSNQKRSSSTTSTYNFKETETKSHNAVNKFHDSKKVPVPETIKEVNETGARRSKDHSQVSRKTPKTTSTRNLPPPPPTPPEPEPKCGCSSRSCTHPASRKISPIDYQGTSVTNPKYSTTSNRSQLEKDFHNLLESLGFVCHPNEPGCTADCDTSKQPNSAALQLNPSLYSIPKANFLPAAKTRQRSESTAPPPTTPAVLLSDDPNDPRRRTDLKAARQYLDNPVIPPKSVYHSELFAKVEANKTRPQRAEGKRPSVVVGENTKPSEQSGDSRRASSQTSIARRKNKPPVVSMVKPINLEQIRSIKQAVDNAIADQKIFVIYGVFPSIREALKSRGWIEKRPYPVKKVPSAENDPTALRNRGSRELFQYGGALRYRSAGLSPPAAYFSVALSPRSKRQVAKQPYYPSDSHIIRLHGPFALPVGVQSLQSADPAVLALIESMSTNPNEVDFEEELTERAIIGRILRNVDPNFIWTVKCEAMDWKRLKKKQLINRYPRAFFATKIGLSTFLRQMHWFSEDGISMTRFPRCYNICQADDMEAFVEDFRLTACLGVLKIVVDRFGKMGDAGVQDENGKVPKYVLEFAISRCVEYLVQNSHADLDQSTISTVHCHQWDQFLAWSYELRSDNGRFSKTCSEPSPQVMRDTSRDVIRRMSEVWPQIDMDGYLNIWILKPGAKSRGRGIHLINRLDAVTEHVSPQHIRDARYVAQKYIERPLIIYGTKFDIRQWFLVTSVYPMTIWMYRESYLRFCSQSFSLTNMHESVHLCNNAVQAKYKNGKRHPALPDENMWDCYTFQTYLRALGRPELWDTVIYPGMRQGIIGTLLASQEHMDRRADCFELFGADFMLTEDFNPWLIEINSCPCMAPSTSVTAKMCAQCLEDVIKVVIDRQNDRNADTGGFELVYKQHIPPPPPYLGMSLSVRGRRVNNNGSTGNTGSAAESPGQSPKPGSRRVRRPASDPTRRRQRRSRILLPSTEETARYRFKEKLSTDSETTVPVDEASSSGTDTDPPTSADNESRPPRTPTPTCPPSRLESMRCTHRPSAVAAMVAKQKPKRVQHNVLAAVGHGVIQPSEDNHKKSMELLREWRQRARTSGLLPRSSPNKLGSLSSAHSAEMMRRMSSSSGGSGGLMAVGVTLNGLMR